MKKFKIIGIIALAAAIAFLMIGCPLEMNCPDCNGSGTCNKCNGSGEDPYFSDYSNSYSNSGSTQKMPCSRCNGTGKCQSCNGSGKVNLANL